MASDSSLEHLSAITLDIEPETLQFEDGDVIMHLSNRTEDTLVLHSSILSASTDRFKRRMRSNWGDQNVPKLAHPHKTEKVKVFEYHLVLDEGAYVLTDERTHLPFRNSTAHGSDDTLRSFHLSDLVEGFPDSTGNSEGLFCDSRYYLRRSAEEVREEMIGYHKMLFGLVYGKSIQFKEGDRPEVIRQIVDMIALADYYWLLPVVASKLESMLLDLPWLWKDVAEFPLLYLAIGNKLRSTEIFSDAIRHYVGRGGSLLPVTRNDVLRRHEACAALMPAQECLRNRTEQLIKTIHEVAFTEYQAHADRPKKRRDLPAGTFWLAATFAGKTLQEMCEWIADSHWREFWEVHVSGKSHWSHIKYSQTHGTDGNVELGSLRKACELLNRAWRQHSNVNVIGKHLAENYTAIFSLHYYARGHHEPPPEEAITERLKSHIRRTHHELRMCFPEGDDHVIGCSHSCHGEHDRAKFDEGLSYFTTIAVNEEDLPWARLPAWKEFKMPNVDLTEATPEWIQVATK